MSKNTSNTLKGHSVSKNTRKKISQTRIQRKIKHSEKTRIKLSLAHKGKKLTSFTKEKMRKSTIKNIEKKKCNGEPLTPNIGKNETLYLDKIEAHFGLKIIRQYPIGGYFLDGYCSSLNLAIEIDEPYHLNQIEKDKKREGIIKEKLNCKFVRIKDIGKAFKPELFNEIIKVGT